MKKVKAFTLIELLVVMAIMGTSLSLVGALVLDQIDKTKANAELKKVEQLIESTAAMAYLTGQSVTMRFDGKSLFIEQGSQSQSTNFDYLFFKQTSLLVNTNGQIPDMTLELTSHRKVVQLAIGAKPK
jgi:prepilin-type N-terminal cleavage/methylation domain-containing protein